MDLVRTVGHGTLSAEELVELLRGAGVDAIADVRRYPGSRRHPHVAREAMAGWLPAAGIAYRWIPALGGRRKGDPDSPHIGLRNLQFRAYADHMASEEFASGVDDLTGYADGRAVAVMCSESVWWRCHRRLLADHLVLLGDTPVEHLMHDARRSPHSPTAGATVQRGALVYEDPGTG